jgi:hypothetical protein
LGFAQGLPHFGRFEAHMSYGRALLTGAGWAGTLGGVALCLLLFLSAFLAFESRDDDVEPRPDGVVRLPDIPDERLPTVPLAELPTSSAGDDGGGGGAGGGSGAGDVRSGGGGGGRRAPEAQTPQSGAGRPAPGDGGTPQPEGGEGAPPASGGGGGGSQPPPPGGGGGNTLGETTRRVTRDAGEAAGHIAPTGGQLVSDTGESAADAVERLPPVPLPDLPQDTKLP